MGDSNPITTNRTGCTIDYYCGYNQIDSRYLGYFTIPNADCRYLDYYCNDGYYLGNSYIGTYFEVVNACTVYEKCVLTDKLLNVYNGDFESYLIQMSYNRNGDCWNCHEVSYCYYPQIGGISHLTIVSKLEWSYEPSYDCTDEGRNPRACYVNLYCDGSYFGSACIRDCYIRSCNLGGIPIEYETASSYKLVDGKEKEIFHNEIIAFDTTMFENIILEQQGKLIDFLDSVHYRNLLNSETDNFLPVDVLPLEESLNLYPNPTSGLVSLDAKLGSLIPASFKVKDVFGSVIMATKNDNLTLDLSMLPSGLYLIESYDVNNMLISTNKIIKL